MTHKLALLCLDYPIEPPQIGSVNGRSDCLRPTAGANLTTIDHGVKGHHAQDQGSSAAPFTARSTDLGDQVCGAHQMSDDNDFDHGWRKVARNFTPSWFKVTMGTGIVSILLYELPYNGKWLYWLSVITFCLNIFLFLLASFISLLRYIMWPEMWTIMMDHPNQSLFLAAVPMVI